MGKIKDSWHRFWKRLKIPGWLTFQLAIVVIVALLFLAIMIWNEALASFFFKRTAVPQAGTLTPTVEPGTPTPLPLEWLESSQQTNGIIFGSIIMVLIIVVSVVVLLFRKGRPAPVNARTRVERKQVKRRERK
jgi:hypothetical protein